MQISIRSSTLSATARNSIERPSTTAPLPLMPVIAPRLELRDREGFDSAKEPVELGVKLIFFGELDGFALSLSSRLFVSFSLELRARAAENFGFDFAADALRSVVVSFPISKYPGHVYDFDFAPLRAQSADRDH
jgi:hypothetical protein